MIYCLPVLLVIVFSLFAEWKKWSNTNTPTKQEIDHNTPKAHVHYENTNIEYRAYEEIQAGSISNWKLFSYYLAIFVHF